MTRHAQILPDDFPRPRIYGGVGPGWWPIIQALHEDLLALDPDYHISQVKEKFGGLRYYASFSPDCSASCEALVRMAEAESYHTCEECGAPGTSHPNSRGWVKTLCSDCRRVADEEDAAEEARLQANVLAMRRRAGR